MAKKDDERVRHEVKNGNCKVAANRIRPQANPLSQSLTLSIVFSQKFGSETEWA